MDDWSVRWSGALMRQQDLSLHWGALPQVWIENQ